ncbi:SpoIID/LytB domain-containing protein [Carboxydochorda subterranea]|uniref:SpoIID/LytB domain-containing protein n=1 Tax=Carboxydichorda subterranea TaxID=3109565 RepID=A0ABZ1BY49_9FIRM|nr:SpoIID/LytB domain-containing protein [Limnochorda sp. L945t]WRP17008.1 SpoIID/LytB domain-containing protein [Limnochorda sp. L945t]
MSNRKRTAVLTTLGLLIVAGAVFYLSGFPGSPPPERGQPGQVQRFQSEPRISLYVNQTGQRTEIPIEQYVAGVVAGEMWENWPESAYAAQAILARTFTLEMMSRGGTRSLHGTDMSTDPVETQAYNPSRISPAIRRAVDSTRGQVLTYQGRYAKAWFHAYSGGQTTTPQEGLGLPDEQAPYLRPVKLPSNPLVPGQFRSWRAEFSEAEVRSALAKKGITVGTIQSIHVTSRGPTGRITQVEVVGSGGRRTISGNDLRVALGSDRMRSTLARTFTFAKGRLVVEGTGSGHGVGLSQWDALLMARQGRSAQQIVQAFYPGARIEKLW